MTDTEYNKGIEPEYELAYIRTSAVKKLQKTTIKEEIVKTEWYLVQDKRLYEEGFEGATALEQKIRLPRRDAR